MTAEFITKHEGRKKRPYKCPAGKTTIGVGHNIDAKGLPKDIEAYLKKHGQITDEMVDRLLIIDIGHAVSDCKKLFPDFDKFTPNRKMALTDFLFQLGYNNASKFVHTVAAINTNRWEDAAKEMLDSDWARQTPNRAQEVTELIEVG